MGLLEPRRLVALAIVASVVASAGACASDPGLDETGTGGSGGSLPEGGVDADAAGGSSASGGGGNNDGGWPSGGFGSACTSDDDCSSGMCRNVGNTVPNQVCVQPCQSGTTCPSGGYCAHSPGGDDLCIPDTGGQCTLCQSDADCPMIGDRCARAPLFDRFCARDCSVDGQCPAGFDCVAADQYPDGTGAGGAGGASGGSGRVCVPANGESCACDTKRDGVGRKCTSSAGSLVCEGTETCNASSGQWEGCTASSTPQPEVCDGADNDCNGTPDDADPAVMCQNAGTPQHATWACNAGQCEIGSCDDGWAYYPPTLPASAGCTCQLDAKERAGNDTCDTAQPAGSVTDANTTALNITGRLHSDTDVDWHSFDTVDSDEGTTNSYHIRIQFTSPVPTNDEFVFDVIRGGTCAEPDANHSGLTTYDWCVDGEAQVGGNTIGEQSCGPQAPRHCGPHDKGYLVRVRRKAGAAGSCQEYTLTVTAKGGSACDFDEATSCDPQTSEI